MSEKVRRIIEDIGKVLVGVCIGMFFMLVAIVNDPPLKECETQLEHQSNLRAQAEAEAQGLADLIRTTMNSEALRGPQNHKQ